MVPQTHHQLQSYFQVYSSCCTQFHCRLINFTEKWNLCHVIMLDSLELFEASNCAFNIFMKINILNPCEKEKEWYPLCFCSRGQLGGKWWFTKFWCARKQGFPGKSFLWWYMTIHAILAAFTRYDCNWLIYFMMF